MFPGRSIKIGCRRWAKADAEAVAIRTSNTDAKPLNAVSAQAKLTADNKAKSMPLHEPLNQTLKRKLTRRYTIKLAADAKAKLTLMLPPLIKLDRCRYTSQVNGRCKSEGGQLILQSRWSQLPLHE
jgi:hypothetical protein